LAIGKARFTGKGVPLSRNLFPIAFSRNCPLNMEKRDARTRSDRQINGRFRDSRNWAFQQGRERQKTRSDNQHSLSRCGPAFLIVSGIERGQPLYHASVATIVGCVSPSAHWAGPVCLTQCAPENADYCASGRSSFQVATTSHATLRAHQDEDGKAGDPVMDKAGSPTSTHHFGSLLSGVFRHATALTLVGSAYARLLLPGMPRVLKQISNRK